MTALEAQDHLYIALNSMKRINSAFRVDRKLSEILTAKSSVLHQQRPPSIIAIALKKQTKIKIF